MRFQVLLINALPLLSGLFLGAIQLSLRGGLSTVRLWSEEPWGTPGHTRVSGSHGLGEAPAQWPHAVPADSRAMMRQHGKNVVAFKRRQAHNLGGSWAWVATHVDVRMPWCNPPDVGAWRP
jgi:hypothetical protein